MSETITDIGEFGLIHRIHGLLEKEGVRLPTVTVGIGDDAASFKPRPGFEILTTCDCLVEGRHYLPDHITYLDLGRRAMAANISDIGAMGGKPLYALVSLGLKADTPISDVDAMYRGFLLELNPFGAAIIGGNLTKTKDAVFIDITLIGEVKQGKLVRRSTAKPGNAILVTGYPGQAAAGLKLLLRSQSTEEFRNHPLVRAYTGSSHRAREGQAIAHRGYATAMIDISDGFLGDLDHICQESGAGAILTQEKLPISEDLRWAAAQLGLDPYEITLGGSDDYELIITCPPKKVNKIRMTVAEVSDVRVTEVGKITDAKGEIQLVLPDGTRRHITPAGWDHFSR